MTIPQILIVEDDDYLGKTLVKALEYRSLEALLAANIADVKKIVQHLDTPPAVAILDMNLGPDEPTGAEVGLFLKQHYGNRCPEFIVYSAYDDSHYYQSAIGLQAAIYLRKAQSDYRTVITHARILAARRAVRRTWSERSAEIRVLIRSCSSTFDAFKRVTRDLLVPELEKVLGVPFFVLLGNDHHQHCFSYRVELPTDHASYDVIQKTIQDITTPGFAALEDLHGDLNHTDPKQGDILERVHNMVGLPLYQTDHIKLSMGLQTVPGRLGEKAEHLAEILVQHFSSIAIERLFSLTHVISQEVLNRQAQMEATARFCIALSQRHDAIRQLAEKHQEIPVNAVAFPQYEKLAWQLRMAGEQIDNAFNQNLPIGHVNLYDICQKAWQETEFKGHTTFVGMESTQGQLVEANQSTLMIALKRLFSWMVDREERVLSGSQIININCKRDDGWVVMTIADQSKRLRYSMRQDLFSPFNTNVTPDKGVDAWLGLYITRVMIEQNSGGQLFENSDQLGQEYGHQFEVRLRHA